MATAKHKTTAVAALFSPTKGHPEGKVYGFWEQVREVEVSPCPPFSKSHSGPFQGQRPRGTDWLIYSQKKKKITFANFLSNDSNLWQGGQVELFRHGKEEALLMKTWGSSVPNKCMLVYRGNSLFWEQPTESVPHKGIDISLQQRPVFRRDTGRDTEMPLRSAFQLALQMNWR